MVELGVEPNWALESLLLTITSRKIIIPNRYSEQIVCAWHYSEYQEIMIMINIH